MEILADFDFFLFDFDGLLVDTERLHYKAYKNALAFHGFSLPWSFEEYCKIAHSPDKPLEKEISLLFPNLRKIYPNWMDFYNLKKRNILSLLKTENVMLMPGAPELLSALINRKIGLGVVTNSSKDLVDIIKSKVPLLNKIENWITRENYRNPKPHGDPYLTAVSTYQLENKKVIGFEDTLFGLTSLKAISAKRVLICDKTHPQLSEKVEADILYYESLSEFLEKN